MGLVVEIMQKIVAGDRLRYPKLVNAECKCFGGKMKTLLAEFLDLVPRRQCGRRRAQEEFESMPHHLPELHGGMIGGLHR